MLNVLLLSRVDLKLHTVTGMRRDIAGYAIAEPLRSTGCGYLPEHFTSFH